MHRGRSRRFWLPLLLLAAAVAVFVARARFRAADAEKAPGEPGGPAASGTSESGGRVWKAQPVGPGIARSLPRFVQTRSSTAGPETIQADLVDDAGSRQAAEDFLQKQARDPSWAPRMEQHLAERLAPAALERLQLGALGLKVLGVECRSYGCQVSVEWSPGALAAAPPGYSPASGPIRHLHEHGGSLGPVLMRRAREVAPGGRTRESYLVFFRDDLREPSAWAARE